MSKRVSYIITDNNITVNYDGQTHIVPRTDTLADRLISAIKTKNLDEIPRLVSTAKRVEEFGQGDFVVQDGRVMVHGVAVPDLLNRKIVRFMNEGLPHEPLVKFAENLLKNPSYRSVNELFQFLEKNDHPITDNGCFIAYKKVRSDFKDAHTGTMDNSPGTVVEMPRNQVNEDSTQTCSHGLHLANWDYANNIYSAGADAKMLEVEVSPADVVSIPADYNQSKMRVCRYTVLGVVDQEHSTDIMLRTTTPATPPACTDNECNECDEEVDYCDDCGTELERDDDRLYDDRLCYECELTREEEEYYCTECDCPLNDVEVSTGIEICDYCVEEEEAEEEEEEDEYPWEDELDEE